MKHSRKSSFCLFAIGGLSYGLLEIFWRRHTHWSMILTGGICFTVLYRIFRTLSACSLWLKCCVGSTVITISELLSGFLFNYCMKLQVWDYSRQHFNFCGQICALYSFLWGLLTIPICLFCRLLHRRFHW